MKGATLLFILFATFGDAHSQESCLAGNCTIDGTQIVKTVGSFHNSWHDLMEQELFGTTCKIMIKGSFRDAKWRWQGRFWCPSLSAIEGYSTSWKSREEAIERVIDDYMSKGEQNGFLTAKQLQDSSNVKSQLISSLFDVKIRHTRELPNRIKRSSLTKENQTRVYSNGLYYGDMVGDDMHGIGGFYYNSGDIYIGAWRNGQKSGIGIYYFKGGPARYVGHFQNGEMTGYGILVNEDGSMYKGDFVSNKRWGYGEQTWTDGNKYIGQFKNDKRHGFGYWFFASGKRRAAFYFDGAEI